MTRLISFVETAALVLSFLSLIYLSSSFLFLGRLIEIAAALQL